MVVPDLELKGRGVGGFALLALNRLFFLCYILVFTHNKGGADPPRPLFQNSAVRFGGLKSVLCSPRKWINEL